VRVASVLNNIANCHRRIGNYAEAHTHIDRAIEILEAAPSDQPSAQLLASAYHSRGLIFAAQGGDTDALDWLVKADAARQKLPSPSLEDTAVDLTELIAVLGRLGRTTEADAARERLASIRTAQQAGRAPELDLSHLSSENHGALLIEIDQPASRSQDYANQIAAFGRRLGEEARASETGFFTGTVTIPEATTLMFYGPDAEALFRALEPTLRSDPYSRTARVAVRQGTSLREFSLSPN